MSGLRIFTQGLSETLIDQNSLEPVGIVVVTAQGMEGGGMDSALRAAEREIAESYRGVSLVCNASISFAPAGHPSRNTFVVFLLGDGYRHKE